MVVKSLLLLNSPPPPPPQSGLKTHTNEMIEKSLKIS